MPTSAAGYVPDPPPIDLQPARVLGLCPPARMIPAHRAKRHRNTAVGGAQHGQRMNGIVSYFFFANPSFLLETAPPSRAGQAFLESRHAYLVWAEDGPGVYYDELYRNIDFCFVAGWLAGPLLICGGWV